MKITLEICALRVGHCVLREKFLHRVRIEKTVSSAREWREDPIIAIYMLLTVILF